MGKMPQMDNVPEGKAVVKPRSAKLNLLAQCGTACHNGVSPKGFPKDNRPVPIPTMESMFPDAKNLQHGRGRIWCLDCHHTTKRNMLVDHFGEPISIDQPQLLCGKCHGDKLRDWRDGIHGKRIGEFVSTARSAGSPAPSATTRTTCRTASATRASCSCSPSHRPNCPRHEGCEVREDPSDRPLMSDDTDATKPARGDPTWVAPALTREEQTRHVGKTPVFFGPPLAILTEGQKNTLEISGKLNRTAERYLALMRTTACSNSASPNGSASPTSASIGFMSPLEIRELPMEVDLTRFECEGLDKGAGRQARAASFADLVAVVESLGF
jgi:hypothetical protein